MHALEDALAISHGHMSQQPHPLLEDIPKFDDFVPDEKEEGPAEKPLDEDDGKLKAALDTLHIEESGELGPRNVSRAYAPAADRDVSVYSNVYFFASQNIGLGLVAVARC